MNLNNTNHGSRVITNESLLANIDHKAMNKNGWYKNEGQWNHYAFFDDNAYINLKKTDSYIGSEFIKGCKFVPVIVDSLEELKASYNGFPYTYKKSSSPDNAIFSKIIKITDALGGVTNSADIVLSKKNFDDLSIEMDNMSSIITHRSVCNNGDSEKRSIVFVKNGITLSITCDESNKESIDNSVKGYSKSCEKILMDSPNMLRFLSSDEHSNNLSEQEEYEIEERVEFIKQAASMSRSYENDSDQAVPIQVGNSKSLGLPIDNHRLNKLLYKEAKHALKSLFGYVNDYD